VEDFFSLSEKDALKSPFFLRGQPARPFFPPGRKRGSLGAGGLSFLFFLAPMFWRHPLTIDGRRFFLSPRYCSLPFFRSGIVPFSATSVPASSAHLRQSLFPPLPRSSSKMIHRVVSLFFAAPGDLKNMQKLPSPFFFSAAGGKKLSPPTAWIEAEGFFPPPFLVLDVCGKIYAATTSSLPAVPSDIRAKEGLTSFFFSFVRTISFLLMPRRGCPAPPFSY